MKWIKVYRGPGYPTDPRKDLLRALRSMLELIEQLVEQNMRFQPEFQIHSAVSRMVSPMLSAIPIVAPFYTPEVEEARRTLLPTRPERVPFWIQPQRHDVYYSEEYAAALRIMEAATGGQDKDITDEQKMDDLQARARQWTKKFLNAKVLTVAEKKERREVEQYMQGGDPLT